MALLDKHGVSNATPRCCSSPRWSWWHRRHRRNRPAVLLPEHHREGGGHAALHPARTGRPQHLRPRRLLRLPLPDDPAVPRRGRTLRPLLAGGGVDVRPSVPVGLQAHRSGPRPRRRPLFQRLACRAPERPALGGARIDHAVLRLPRRAPTLDTALIADHLQANVDGRRALYARTPSPMPAPTSWPRRRPMPTRPGCAERYPNGATSTISTAIRAQITEMDALVAYLQMLGTLVDFSTYEPEQNYR